MCFIQLQVIIPKSLCDYLLPLNEHNILETSLRNLNMPKSVRKSKRSTNWLDFRADFGDCFDFSMDRFNLFVRISKKSIYREKEVGGLLVL